MNVIEQYDYSRVFLGQTDALGRPYQGERARPLQTLVWYPAQARGVSAMTVRHYVELCATEVSFGEPRWSPNTKDLLRSLSRTLGMPLWATRDASRADGSFPLIVYAPSYSGVSWENADLCEYLASYGYVVIASPNMGAMTREMSCDLAGIDAQVRDIEFLIAYAHSLPNVDISRIGVVGFSWGGLSNVCAAACDNRIRALVALDGSVRYLPGLVRRTRGVHPLRMAVPLLYCAQQYMSIEDLACYTTDEQRDGPSVLTAWTHGDLTTVDMLGLIHWEFSSMYQRNEDRWTDYFPQQQRGDYSREDGMIGYGWMAVYTLAFLDAYLKHDRSARQFIRNVPVDNGVPRHVMSVRHRPASAMPPTLDGFRSEIGRRGFNHCAAIYAEMQARSADFQLELLDLSSWSLELITTDCVREAIALLEFGVQVHRFSARLYITLGDAYLRLGERQRSFESYNKALEAEPRNQHIHHELKAKFRALEGNAGAGLRMQDRLRAPE